ncbi:MAG: type II toxin-antitoxin system RelE/ParE family toxin [Betaproteobacteria bacterium]|nr:MAG: type II toxin-antitoxin system RelE/ParE family toxin [Betaproteobacteria bacterium]
MPRLVFAPRALDDLTSADQLPARAIAGIGRGDCTDHHQRPAGAEAASADRTVRQTERGLRELLISCGRTGYVALYEYHPATDAVLVLAVRHQRETRAC